MSDEPTTMIAKGCGVCLHVWREGHYHPEGGWQTRDWRFDLYATDLASGESLYDDECLHLGQGPTRIAAIADARQRIVAISRALDIAEQSTVDRPDEHITNRLADPATYLGGPL